MQRKEAPSSEPRRTQMYVAGAAETLTQRCAKIVRFLDVDNSIEPNNPG